MKKFKNVIVEKEEVEIKEEVKVEVSKEPTLPKVEGVQAIEILKETDTAIEYKLENGCTTFVSKK